MGRVPGNGQAYPISALLILGLSVCSDSMIEVGDYALISDDRLIAIASGIFDNNIVYCRKSEGIVEFYAHHPQATYSRPKYDPVFFHDLSEAI